VGLQVKPQKCEFHKTITESLEMQVTPEGLKMDPGNVSVMEQWPVPQGLRDVQPFTGPSNLY
jgi:hypothetical protein